MPPFFRTLIASLTEVGSLVEKICMRVFYQGMMRKYVEAGKYFFGNIIFCSVV